jgi:hypothetical protein
MMLDDVEKLCGIENGPIFRKEMDMLAVCKHV